MCYKEYARESTHRSIIDTKQKEEMTLFVNKSRNKKWLEIEGNMCIASRPEQKHFSNKIHISLSLQSLDKDQVPFSALSCQPVILNNMQLRTTKVNFSLKYSIIPLKYHTSQTSS